MEPIQDVQVMTILNALHRAFFGVHPGEISLHEAEIIDRYGTDEERAKARDIDIIHSCWTAVPDEHVAECPNALYHLDTESWRFYIPCYVSWTLRHLNTRLDSGIPDITLFNFNPLSEDCALYKYHSLNAEQSKVICRFLRCMARHPGLADDAEPALRKYWATFCDETAHE